MLRQVPVLLLFIFPCLGVAQSCSHASATVTIISWAETCGIEPCSESPADFSITNSINRCYDITFGNTVLNSQGTGGNSASTSVAIPGNAAGIKIVYIREGVIRLEQTASTGTLPFTPGKQDILTVHYN